MTKFADSVIETVSPYIKDEGARHVIRDIFCFIKTAEQVLVGEVTDDTKRMMSATLIAFSGGLASNAFWMQHGSYITPVMNSAIGAWMDSFGYLASAENNSQNRMAFMVTHNAIPEVATAVLYCEQGAHGVVQHSMALRTALLELSK